MARQKKTRPPMDARAAEGAVRLAEGVYRAVFETTGSAMAIVENDLTISLANEQFARVIDRPREGLEGRVRWSDFIAPKHVERMREYHRARRVDPAAAPAVYESQLIDGAGTARDILVTVSMLPGSKRSVISFSDITELKRAQAAHQTSEIRYRELFTNMTNGVAVYEAVDHGDDFIIADMNEAGRLLTGAERTVIGMRVTEAFPGVKEMGLFDVFRRVWRTGKPEHLAAAPYQDERSSAWFENQVYKLPSGEIVAIYENVTQRKQDEEVRFHLQEQLHQVRKLQAVGQLAAGVAHDFNNLITVMLGSVDQLKPALAGDADLTAAVRSIEQAALEAAGVTRSLMTFSRDVPAEKRVVDVRRVLEEAQRLLSRVVTASVELRTEASGESPLWVNADPTQLQQVLLNLVINARDAMPRGGTLHIRADEVPRDVLAGLAINCTSAERYVRLEVQDTGTGIAPEVREHIFEPFFTTKERGHGTGLGLAIVHGIVQHHGGAVTVQSETDRGTTLTVYLPRQPAPAPADEAGLALPVPAGHGEHVLLAEDDEHVREIMVSTLRSLGYSVDAVGDGPAIFDALTAKPDAYRLFVFDVDLPRANGFDCLQTLRDQGIRTPAILISGTAELDTDTVQAANATLLHKPFLMGELGRVVWQAIESRTLADAGLPRRR